MLTMTLPHTRPETGSQDDTARRDPRSRAIGMLFAGAVAAVAALFVGTLTLPDGDRPDDVPHPPAGAAVEDASFGITTTEQNVSVVTQVYLPGQRSGWHAHSGVHAVAVLSGTLTVYDEHCQRSTYEPGRPYVGGRQVHLATNETHAPVEMVVTYLSPVEAADSNRQGAPPAGCAARGVDSHIAEQPRGAGSDAVGSSDR
jgi:quercetin dioxygenase-like cupin family protein